MERLEDAERTLQQGLELELPQLQDQLYLGLGCLEVQRANWEKAREHFASAERHNAGASARLLRCWCLCMLDQKEVASNLIDSMEALPDPLDSWIQQRVKNLLSGVPEPWPPAEERPWVLRGHSARAILNRLLPTQRRETLVMQIPSTPAEPVVEARPSKGGGLHPALALVGLFGLAMIGYGLKQMIQERTSVAVVSQSATATPLPTPEASASPANTPTPAPTESFRPPEKVKLSVVLVPQKTGWLTVDVDGEPEKMRIEKGRFVGKFHSGTHAVTIEVAGYEKVERELPFLEPDVLNVQLVPLKVDVNISAAPGPVRVQVDNQSPKLLNGTGTVKGTFPLTFGKHTLKVTKYDYITESKSIEIQSEEPRNLSFKLQPVPPPEPAYIPPPAPSYPAPAPYYPPAPAPYYPPAPAPPPAPANPYSF